MPALPFALNNLYQRYAEVDRARGDFRYLRAVESLIDFYTRVGSDSGTMRAVSGLIIEDFEEKQQRINDLLRDKRYDELSLEAKALQSSIRNIVSEEILFNAKELEHASKGHDFTATFNAWSSLHQSLYPIFVLMRQVVRR